MKSINHFLSLLILWTHACFALNPGDIAPNFTLLNHENKEITLSSFKGKFVILEWFNSGCPYVKKFYQSETMQTLQALYENNPAVVWLTINSSAKGKQGYLASQEAAKKTRSDMGMKSVHLLRDAQGRVGQLYGAKTTPHIFILDTERKLQYMGAIDSIESADPTDITKARNYITASMSKLLLQEKPNPAKTRPYGCSVKY